MSLTVIILVGIATGSAALVVVLYNRLTRMRIKSREAFQSIQILLEKKNELLPKLTKGANQENFGDYTEAMTKLESEHEYAARYYNAVVREYNTALETFPSTLVAILLNFKKMEFHEAQQNSLSDQF